MKSVLLHLVVAITGILACIYWPVLQGNMTFAMVWLCFVLLPMDFAISIRSGKKKGVGCGQLLLAIYFGLIYTISGYVIITMPLLGSPESETSLYPDIGFFCIGALASMAGIFLGSMRKKAQGTVEEFPQEEMKKAS